MSQNDRNMMDDAVTIYVLLDDALRAQGHQEDSRRRMSDAEVLTTAFMSTLYFGGNLEKARNFLHSTGLIPQMLSKSRLNRRLHALAETLWRLFHQLGQVIKEQTQAASDVFRGQYLVDSFPIAVCDNIRISRCRLTQLADDPEVFRGYIASKRRYFYGLRVHVLTTATGIPVEIGFLPGSAHDLRGLNVLPLSLPEGSELYADKAYTDYEVEDVLAQLDGIRLNPLRKKNSTRWEEEPAERAWKQQIRRRIETVFSQIAALFPMHLHAVTLSGLVLKVLTFVFGFMLEKAFI